MRDRGSGRVGTQLKSEARGRAVARALLWGLVLLSLSAVPLVGQQAPRELTLEEAIALAKANNPTFLSTQNDEAEAKWRVREAWGRFVPSVTANGSGAWQQEGVQRIGSLVFADQITDWYFSNYSLNLGFTLSGNTIFGVPNARANKRATEARISAAEFDLESLVALQYMAVLRGVDGAEVAQRQLERARRNLEIVTTRVQTGAVAGTAGKRAEVDLGRAEVGVIQARRDLRQARLLLSEQMGVRMDEDVRLLSEFNVFEPDFDPERLLRMAIEDHPSLRSVRAQEDASRAAARQAATSQYLPTISLSTSFRGNAIQALNDSFVLGRAQDRADAGVRNCDFNNLLNDGLNGGLPGYTNQDCSIFELDDAGRAAARAANDVFPFNFTKLPVQVGLSISLPIFTGFSRQRQVSQANNLAEDAQHARRAEELRIRTRVTNTYDNLLSAYRVVQVESRNRTLAEEQLLLQQRRFALGAAGVLLLMDAQTTMTTAEQAYLTAVYDFHYNLIALEAAVGQPLRPR